MADNKEITTLHPYMNRNKNRYPNVKEENIPDTIQRKLTAGQGINISSDNVISATGGDSYTRDETDALLDTKADKVALENVNKAVPTDIAVKNGKLGLEHDTTWLTNQNAITLGDGLTYDETTKTLKAEGSGATLPAGTEADPLNIGEVKLYNKIPTELIFEQDFVPWIEFKCGKTIPNIHIDSLGANRRLSLKVDSPSFGNSTIHVNYDGARKGDMYSCTLNKTETGLVYSSGTDYHAIAYPTIDGIYNLQLTKSGSSYHYDWVIGERKTYNHYIVISDGTASNAIYLLIPSTNSLICSSLPELNTLLGTTNRFIQASGVVTDAASKLPIVAIKWQGSFSSSKIVTMSSEEATTKFTDISDIVEPA